MFFRNEYIFLSNMYYSPIRVNVMGKDYTFTCVESAFQAMKDISRIEEFQELKGPEAKRLGKRVKLRSDWNDVRVPIMEELVRIKFQDEDLLKRLCTIEGEIVEDNNWNDTFWGKCNGIGQNNLGKILMKVRDRALEV